MYFVIEFPLTSDHNQTKVCGIGAHWNLAVCCGRSTSSAAATAPQNAAGILLQYMALFPGPCGLF